MTTQEKIIIEEFSGISKQFGSNWWAMCDQLPVAACGNSYSESLQAILQSIHTYRGFLNGSGLPKPNALPRTGAPDERPFQFNIAIE